VQRKLKVNIPAGVADGNRLRLAGEGQPGGNGGPPGDLYVFLKVKEHAFFERHENDLHCTIPLNVAQASLGCEIEVPTLGQPHKLKIPEGTQNGAQFKLRHQGVAILNSSARGVIRPYQRQDAHAPHPRAAQAPRTVARYPSGGQPACERHLR
jgi:molecular chaperone DnaJ